jgi:hypothetical protein
MDSRDKNTRATGKTLKKVLHKHPNSGHIPGGKKVGKPHAIISIISEAFS